ncbi:hypothetical protein [Bifidobacterium pseudolongum]|uniref:hypothetical protein n=1 Tax=Bifidobacterium pseudolongum TaxID=1694 RepID=UPI0013EE3B43|nr:hypothetical protein [Bifidobacterium pseudolongum]
MSQKTRINLYLDEAIGEAFKRYCKSKKKSYSEIAEGLFYRLLSTPTTNNESSLTTVQSQIHDEAVNAYRQVYETHRQAIIETAITEADDVSDVSDVSPHIPMPQPSTTPEVNHYGTPRTRTNRLSKREISR